MIGGHAFHKLNGRILVGYDYNDPSKWSSTNSKLCDEGPKELKQALCFVTFQLLEWPILC